MISNIDNHYNYRYCNSYPMRVMDIHINKTNSIYKVLHKVLRVFKYIGISFGGPAKKRESKCRCWSTKNLLFIFPHGSVSKSHFITARLI